MSPFEYYDNILIESQVCRFLPLGLLLRLAAIGYLTARTERSFQIMI